MNARQKQILTCVVDSFINSYQPISSGMVLERLRLNLSSATVRQIFSALDHFGYIEKLHSSSGRIPTIKGYREYVDLINHCNPAINLNEHVSEVSTNVKFRWLFEQILTNLSNKMPYIGLIWLHAVGLPELKCIKYVPINSHHGLVLLFHRLGTVSEHYIRFDQDISNCNTSQLIANLNRNINQKKPMFYDPFNQSDAYFLNTLLKNIQSNTENATPDCRLIKNVSRCLSLADYQDKASLQQLLSLLDDQKGLDKLMRPNGNSTDSFEIKIGNELKDDRLANASMVFMPILMDGRPIARLAIMGPSRMDYASIIDTLSSKETLAELIQV